VQIRILHAYYGCDTGCCGHIIEIDEEEEYRSFEFGHADESDRDDEEFRQWVLKYVPKECHDAIDWNSIEFDDMSWC